ncbi:MAG: MFS transporter [Oscillatoria sp. PMC 1051.18]|nr:MFS transporter [Oscillatoria sp. PMC 1050.18]MEC5033061.1 MFS transporter [Oscillatoria sp. PMC 1051.18]
MPTQEKEITHEKQEQTEKPTLNFFQLWNMSFGFFGIQYGWALQFANTSAIYEYLGAEPEQIPMLWLAAPLSGLIVQPIVGHLSDRTWGFLGRRRPYFLVGAILSSTALILMPNSSTLWMAAGLLWILDTSVNISLEPFRAFVADILPLKQRTQGFAMQSFFIGFGAVVAAISPWLLANFWGVTRAADNQNGIPLTVKISFYLGAAVFLITVLWTIVTTKEYPPEDLAAFRKKNSENGGFVNGVKELFHAYKTMPETMKQLGWVQFFTWLGMFCVLLYFPPAVARYIFGAIDRTSPIYTYGIEWAGICIGVYNGVCFIFSLFLAKITQLTSRKITHAFCLFCGGAALMSLLFIRDPYLLFIPMICLGLAWASMLAIPYSILADALPAEETGVYLGIFNAFIVIPQIIAALGLGWVMHNFLDNNHLMAVVLGGTLMIVASLLVAGVEDVGEEKEREVVREKLTGES